MDYNNFCAFLPSDATHSAVMRLHVVRLSVTFRYRVQIGFDFALTYSFQGSHLCDSVIFLFYFLIIRKFRLKSAPQIARSCAAPNCFVPTRTR